jgi:trk system potassium uptake protein
VFGQKTSLVTPGRLVTLSVIAASTLGALLLALPCAHKVPIAFIDLFFIAISATSVTGLATVPLESFTLFGQIVILALIQIGGLGLITMSVFLISFFLELGLGTQLLTGHLLELESSRSVRQLITFIVSSTLIAEVLGTLLIWRSVIAQYGPYAFFYSLFHAISSFCNAGFTLFPLDTPLLRNNVTLLLVTGVLVTVGGLGFISLHEILRRTKDTYEGKRARLSLHTRVILITTALIILLGCLSLWFLEYRSFFQYLSPVTAFANVFFNTTCARSAGLSTFDMASLRLPTLFVIMLIAFIGSSPGSTGGGIKTTTFAIFFATIRAVISGRLVVSLRERTISNEQVFKAMAIFSLSLTWIAIALFALLLAEEGWHFVDLLFESISAFANLGLTTGITPYLSAWGKIVIMVLMLIGRIGSLTLIIALKRQQGKAEFRYPEERIALS